MTPHSPRDFAVVINKNAGTLRQRAPGTGARVRAWVDQHADAEHVHVIAPRKIDACLQHLHQQGIKRIGLGGGDGTLSHSAQYFIDHDLTMVPLPMGTLNHFCRDLGYALEPDDWYDRVTNQGAMEVDIGQVNGRLFLNNFSIGLYPRLVKHRQQISNERICGSKTLATWWSALQLLANRPRPHNVEVTVGDDAVTARTCDMLLVSNNAYQPTDEQWVGRDELASGELSLYLPLAVTGGGILSIAQAFFDGRLNDCDDIELLQADRLQIQFQRQQIAVAIDGELTRLATPLQASSRHRHLRVAAP